MHNIPIFRRNGNVTPTFAFCAMALLLLAAIKSSSFIDRVRCFVLSCVHIVGKITVNKAKSGFYTHDST